MSTTRRLLALVLTAVFAVGATGCSAQGEISDDGINAEVEGDEGGDG